MFMRKREFRRRESHRAAWVSFLSVTSTMAAMIIAGEAMASGFQIREQSSSGQGTSFAGATSHADLSTIYFNPAGLTALSQRSAQTELAFVLPSAKFGDGGSTVNTRPKGGPEGIPAV